MPTLSDLLVSAVDLAPSEIHWLQRLVGDWQLVSDLAFADLILWVPLSSAEGEQWLAVAQCRPSTGPTAFHDDLVGRIVPEGATPLVAAAWRERRVVRDRDPHWNDEMLVRQEASPVVYRGRRLAVLSRQTNLAAARTPSRLELTYLQCADDLVEMISIGEFPTQGDPPSPRHGAPRAGDGLIRLDAAGIITYASPNGVSALHRAGYVGQLVARSLNEVVTELIDSTSQRTRGAFGATAQTGVAERVDESLPLVLTGRAPWRSDVELGRSALAMRAIPLTRNGERFAAIVLVRDVTDVRRRERELMSKDATIREVHHRVKNNLQTVAALLRLQARRITSPDGKAALEEAMRRVATIAMVHETLSEGFGERVDFDQVADRTATLAVEVAGSGTSTGRVRVRREGSFGELETANATPLALVLTELVANAVEHGLAGDDGEVVILALREGQALRFLVRDSGRGLPEGFQPGVDGLGTQIVQALVGGEMRGTISWHPLSGGGTEVVVDVALRGTAPARASSRPGDSARGDRRPSGVSAEVAPAEVVQAAAVQAVDSSDDAGDLKTVSGDQVNT